MSTVLISHLRNRLIVEVPGCPVPAIDLAVINAARQMCEDTYAYTKSFESENIDYTTIDSADNDAITLSLTTILGWVGAPISVCPLTPIAPLMFQIDGANWLLRELVLENDNSNLTNIEIQGVKFFNFPSTSTMKIFPFTDQTANFDIFLKLAVKPRRVSAGEEYILSITLPDADSNDWYEGIIHCAAHRLQMMPGRPWTNINHALYNKSEYNHYMGRVKIDAAMGGSAGSTVVKGGYF